MKELLRHAEEIPVTLVLGLAFLTMAFVTDPVDPTSRQLVAWGACRAFDVADGEPWRLVTYAFLHGGILHLGLNCHALVYLGPLLERSLGSRRFVCLWLVGAVAGGIGGCLWHHPLAPLVGGSGALFAMLGALVALLARSDRDPLAFVRQPVGVNVLGNIATNFAIGLMIPVVSNAAHLGGLLAGFALTYWFLLPPRPFAQPAGPWRLGLAVAFVGALAMTLWPVTRADRLLLAWDATPEPARRAELHTALQLTTPLTPSTGTWQVTTDADLQDLVDSLQRARRAR